MGLGSRRRSPGRRCTGAGSAAARARLLGVAMVVVSALGARSLAAASPGGPAGPKPDYSYFAGKTVTIVTFAAAGSASDIEIRAIAGALSPLLQANVVVQDTPSGGGIPGQDVAAAAPPNGLTIGVLNLSQDVSDQAQHIPGVNFALKDLELIGGLHATAALLISSTSTGPATIEQLLTSKRPISILVSYASSFSIFVHMLIAAYHANNLSMLSGYPNPQNLVQGFQRGDGPVTGTSLATLAPLITAGLARPILLERPVTPGIPMYAQLRKIPTTAQLAQTFPPKTRSGRIALQTLIAYSNASNNWIFLPHKTPKGIELALVDALAKVMAEPAIEAQLVAVGLPPGEVPASQGAAAVRAALKAEPVLARFLAS